MSSQGTAEERENSGDVPSPQRVCFMKGFARGIEFQDDEAGKIAHAILSSNYDAYYWDGDLFRADSFTRVVRDVLLAELPRNKRAATFKHVSSANKVLDPSYASPFAPEFSFGHPVAALPLFDRIQVVPVDGFAKDDYLALGQHALRTVLRDPHAAVDVHFIGGGQVACSELAALRANPAARRVRCHVWNVRARNGDGTPRWTALPTGASAAAPHHEFACFSFRPGDVDAILSS